MTDQKIYQAIWALGEAIHRKGFKPAEQLAIKLKAPVYDELTREMQEMMGHEHLKYPDRFSGGYCSIGGVKVTKVDQ